MYYSSVGLGLFVAGILITIYAQIKVHSAFKKGSKLRNQRGITGAETALLILKNQNLGDIPVQHSGGRLSDNYNPLNRTVNLSEGVYDEATISALAVAAHEVGHALQHRDAYAPLKMRTAIYPVVSFSSYLAPILIIAGFLVTSMPMLLNLGILLFAVSVFFTLVTLPVEFDASRRAMLVINQMGLVSADESQQVKKVLNAAALTYVAAAATAIMELARLILIAKSQD